MLDDNAQAAVLAVPSDLLSLLDIEKFFDLVLEIQAGPEAPGDVDGLVAAIGAANSSFGAAAEQYRENLRLAGLDAHWPDIARAFLGEGSGATLANYYSALAAQESDGADTEADQYAGYAEAERDPAGVWADLIGVRPDYWSTFDGSAERWPEWRTAFEAEVAANYPGALSYLREDALPYLDGVDAAGRLAGLRDLGFTVDETLAVVAVADVAAVDPAAAWAELVGLLRDSWADFDGSDESWPAWRDWLLGEAGNQLGGSAYPHLTDVVLADLTEDLGPVARLRRLEALGFAVNQDTLAAWLAEPEPEPVPGAGAGGQAGEPSEAIVRAAEALVEAAAALPPDTAMLVTPEVAREAFAAVPAAAELSPEEIAAVLREVADLAKEPIA